MMFVHLKSSKCLGLLFLPILLSCKSIIAGMGIWQSWQRGGPHFYNKTDGVPDGPMVKNPPCNAGDAGLIPGQGTRTPHAEALLSLCPQLLSPHVLEPMLCNKRARVHNKRCHMTKQRSHGTQLRPDANK